VQLGLAPCRMWMAVRGLVGVQFALRSKRRAVLGILRVAILRWLS